MDEFERIRFDQMCKRLSETFPYGHPLFIPLALEELAVHSAKNKDYAQGGDPLGNFKRVSVILSNYPGLDITKPAIVALIYTLKQLDATLWMLAKGYGGEIEGIESRLSDVSVYVKLALILWKEKDGA